MPTPTAVSVREWPGVQAASLALLGKGGFWDVELMQIVTECHLRLQHGSLRQRRD